MSNRQQSASGSQRIHVVAGVMRDRGGRVLVAQRPVGRSMAGAWEFPGGKIEGGESRFEGLVREFREELGVEVHAARPLIRYKHSYPELNVDLDAWIVEEWSEDPHGREGQAVGWHHPHELKSLGLLPADDTVVRALQLPTVCAVTPDQQDVQQSFLDAVEILAGCNAEMLLVLRRPGLSADNLLALAAGVACRIEGTKTKLVLHGDPRALGPCIDALPEHLGPRLRNTIAGLHMPGRLLEELDCRPVSSGYWFGVSCHDDLQLERTLAIGANYAFLGPIKPTASHLGQAGIGWAKFEALVRDLPLPVYAIGGLGPEDLSDAWAHGAQGIAAIRSLWPS